MRRISLVPLLAVLAIAAAVPSTASAVGPPIVKTEAATLFFNTEATLNATVNPMASQRLTRSRTERRPPTVPLRPFLPKGPAQVLVPSKLAK